MIEKRVLFLGFTAGVVIGLAILASRPSTRLLAEQSDIPVVQGNSGASNTRKADEPADASYRQATQPSAFEQMAAEVARGQGWKISLNQLIAIAKLTGGAPAGVLPPEADPSRSPARDPYAVLSGLTPNLSGSRSNEIADPASLTDRYFREQPRSMPDVADSAVVRPNVGAIDVRTGQFLAPAGPGGYVDPRNGTVYAPAGPNGVVNTRTGEYSPVSH